MRRLFREASPGRPATQDVGGTRRAARRSGRWTFNTRFVFGRPGDPMLERWRLVQTPLFGVYIHFIYREDLDPIEHDHPWTFWSLILRGGYDELYRPEARLPQPAQPRTLRRGHFRRFPMQAAHRITAVRPRTTTLVFVGRKVRTWGFFYEDGDWVAWDQALGLRPTEGAAHKRIGTQFTDHAALTVVRNG